MKKEYKDMIIDDIHETEIQFCFYNDLGMDIEQVKYIKALASKYLKEYPEVGIQGIYDYFTWDYDYNEQFNEYNYTHNTQGQLYRDQEDLAQYCDEDRIIGFNHIRLHNMKLEDDSLIHQLEIYAIRGNEINRKIEDIRRRGIPESKIEIILNKCDMNFWKKHGIDYKSFTLERFDIILIRMLEEALFLKRIVIHEIGHAIANTYCIADYPEIINLFDENKNGFENIDEFIAECFMVSEFTNQITLANKVKRVILDCKSKMSQS